MFPSLPCRISYPSVSTEVRNAAAELLSRIADSGVVTFFSVPQIHHSIDPSFHFLVAVLCRWCHGGCMDCFLSFNSYRSACLGFY